MNAPSLIVHAHLLYLNNFLPASCNSQVSYKQHTTLFQISLFISIHSRELALTPKTRMRAPP